MLRTPWSVHHTVSLPFSVCLMSLFQTLHYDRKGASISAKLLITARVAKRAKVMFLQVFVILSPTWGRGGRCYTKCNMGPNATWDQARTSTPPSGPGQNIYPPPPPGTRSEHLPPPHLRLGHSTPPPPHTWDLVTPPPPPPPHLRLGHSTPPPPPETWSLHPTPPPETWSLHPTPPPQTTRRRAVRILLECILVLYYSTFSNFCKNKSAHGIN